MRLVLIALLFFCDLAATGQWKQPGSGEIQLRIRKLNVLGSVLYIAAHPDDENTNVISFLANERLYDVGYLSLTRGDGGQNLIGPEFRDLLGLIRTQELLAARRIDRGRQFFTRANDFGFSKNPAETFRIWNKDTVLSDVVRVIRQFKPDVIIARFPPDERAGHGHHTASALLAAEAIPLAADPAYQPGQVKYWGVWTVKRLYTNTGRWWNPSASESTPGVVTLNVGAYNPLLGKSYTELAAESRSQHKSQGFGVPNRRGDLPEYFEFRMGERADKDLWEGVDAGWGRVPRGEAVSAQVDALLKSFNPAEPAASIPALLKIRAAIRNTGSGLWQARKLQEVDELIQAAAGLFVQFSANHYHVPPGDRIQISGEIISRLAANFSLRKLQSQALQLDTALQQPLATNKNFTLKINRRVDAALPYSDPYWLRKPHGLGYFEVENQQHIGMPENEPAISIRCVFLIGGEELVLQVPVIYKWTDPVKGELIRPLEIVPAVTVRIEKPNYIFTHPAPQQMQVTVTGQTTEKTAGVLSIEAADGWIIEPRTHSFSFNRRDEEQTFRFTVSPTPNCTQCTLTAVAQAGRLRHDRSLQTISYDHILPQIYLPPAQAQAIFINLKTVGKNIGYIAGAGDGIPEALRMMGYQVWEMKNEEVTPSNLNTLDAVVLGIRAINTNARIGYLMTALHEYVKRGGTLVVQYNNNFDLEMEAARIAPYPLTLSRERVTDEEAPVRFLQPDHPVLNYPNQITPLDFKDWVQERGLYFPSQWDSAFQPILSMNDAGEPPRDGGLLVARYGEGYYIYTGLSFFRQLPEGVAGAYRLFANLVSLRAANSAVPPQPVKEKKRHAGRK
jgi:LmbE family N-acetylglucosaminyl deacetylase